MGKLQPGINDLETWCKKNGREELLEEWDCEKNGGKKPSDYTYRSGQKVWWKCNRGHEWQSTIANRSNGNSCPYCSNKAVLKGYNDLQARFPEIAKEWHPTKNGDLSPTDYVFGSAKKVWWLGKCGHEWEAMISNRQSGNGCPICAKELQTSFPEQAIYYYIKQVFSDAKNSDNMTIGMELDIYIPSIRTAIEYDGIHWHKTNKFEQKKNKLCKDNGVKLIRVREKGLPMYSDCVCIERDNYNSIESLNEIIHEIFNILGVQSNFNININKDATNIFATYLKNKKSNSLAMKYPELTKEWHPTKNGNLKPTMVTLCSSKKVWWKCEMGHEWQAAVYSRASGKGCPYCSGRYAIKGVNDLATTNPKLASEWHPTKNGEIKPHDVMPNTTKKIWWLCSKGHEWQTTVNERTRGRGCPICSGKKVLVGFNDLATINPELAKEWHPTKNGNLLPTMFAKGSHKKVWWKCKNGHEWEAEIKSRASGSGCPYCSGRFTIKKMNDLATTNPELAKEWHPTKNGNISPCDVKVHSNKRVWWLCSKGHEWQAIINDRVRGNGCPYCNGRNHQKIQCIETNEVFSNFNDAAKSCNLANGDGISACCHRKQKTAGGYHWKFYEEKGEEKIQ